MPADWDFFYNPCANIIISWVKITDRHTDNSFLSDVLLDGLRHAQVQSTIYFKPLLKLEVDVA